MFLTISITVCNKNFRPTPLFRCFTVGVPTQGGKRKTRKEVCDHKDLRDKLNSFCQL